MLDFEEIGRRLRDIKGMIFLDYDSSFPKPIIERGPLYCINYADNQFLLHMCENWNMKFKFEDLGIIAFSENDEERVKRLLEKLPETNQTVYIVHRCKDMVEICTCTGYSLPDMCYKDADGVEQKVRITEAGKKFFLNEEDACAELMPLE